MITYYDKQGNIVTDIHELNKLFEDPEYKRVAQTTLSDSKWVSTVWLGINHRYNDDDPPLIFETMVFLYKGDYMELDGKRYSTEKDALRGHDEMVAKWSTAKSLP